MKRIKQETLYELMAKRTAKAFDYPVSFAYACPADICTYMKSVKL